MPRDLLIFVAVVLGLGYAVEAIWMTIAWGVRLWHLVLGIATMYTPFIAACVVAKVRFGRVLEGLKVFGLRKGFLRYLPLGLAIPYAMYGIGVAIASVIGLPVVNPVAYLAEVARGRVRLLPGVPLEIQFVIALINCGIAGITINLLAALGEEMGWRGYLFYELVPRLGLYRAALAIGVIWSLWHAPLILVKGYNYPQHPDIVGLAIFTLFCVSLSTVMIQLRALSKSILAPSALHGTINALGGLMFYTIPEIDKIYTIPAGLLAIASLIIIALALDLYIRIRSIPLELD